MKLYQQLLDEFLNSNPSFLPPTSVLLYDWVKRHYGQRLMPLIQRVTDNGDDAMVILMICDVILGFSRKPTVEDGHQMADRFLNAAGV